MNRTIVFLIILSTLIFACQNKPSNNNTNANNNVETEQIELEYLPNGLPKSEKGITVVSKNGWTKDQMDFQQRYCESMFEKLEDYEPIKFCECFLDKIQYYYDPIYVRESYEDQKKWNSYCLQEAAQ